MRRKSPKVVKHVVKGEKSAYSPPKAGKNKPNNISEILEHYHLRNKLRNTPQKTAGQGIKKSIREPTSKMLKKPYKTKKNEQLALLV